MNLRFPQRPNGRSLNGGVVAVGFALAASATAPAPAAAQKAAVMPARTTAVPAPKIVYSKKTRPLYSYRRDDSTPVTHIYINAAHQGSVPLSQFVFGNFIEHLGNVIYDTLWANAIRNPSLEPLSDQQIVPTPWRFDGPVKWQLGGYMSPRCVRILGTTGMASQRTYLPVQRTHSYSLNLYARCTQIPNGGIGSLTVALRAGDERPDGPILVSTVVPVAGPEFQQHLTRWNVPASVLAPGQPVWLTIRNEGVPIDVDQIELTPDDAIDGMDPDVIAAARAWDIPILRLAGNFSSGYHWRDGVGAPLARPTQPNVAWPGGVETNRFGTDELADFARLIGNVPLQIGVNAGDGTADEAAAWVQYCEQKKIPVAMWEIGNELYGGWQIGHTDASGNAARFVEFRDAMLNVDPALTLMATGKADEFLPAGITRDREWNDAVLASSIAGGAKPPAYLTIHPLVPLPGGLSGLSYDEQFNSAMAHPAFLDSVLIPELVNEITNVESADASTRIAPTEWGIIRGGDHASDGPNSNVEAAVVYNALTLNTFLKNGDWVTLANMTALLHGGGIKKDRGIVYVDPIYYVQELYARAGLKTPIETDSAGPGHDVPTRSFLPGVANVSDVDAFSALTVDGSHMVLFVVNRTLDQPRPIRVDVSGFPARSTTAMILTSVDPQAKNSASAPQAVVPQPFAASGSALIYGDGRVVIPPHSLLVVTYSTASRPASRQKRHGANSGAGRENGPNHRIASHHDR